MARTTYGDIITELTGSIGGVTFQRNSSGKVARLRPYTCVNPTPAQQTRQLALSNLIAYWSTLTLSQKDKWDELAAAHTRITPWGEEKTLSGYQWFLSYNLIAYSQGFGPYATPSAFIVVEPVSQFTLDADPTYLKIKWAEYESFFGTYAGIYATPPLRQTSLKLRRPTYLIKLWETTNTKEIDITSFYEQYFGIVWSSFYASAKCSIIVRMSNYAEDSGYQSTYTSAIINIGL